MRRIYFILFTATTLKASAQNDTFRVYFDLGIYRLNEPAMQRLDSMLYHQVLAPGKKVGIIGYADYVGSDSSNMKLSEARAETIKQYLLSSGYKQADIQMVVARGEIPREMTAESGYALDRKVEIIPGGIKYIPPPKKQQIPPALPKLDITKVKKNETLRMEHVYFEPGSHMPLPSSIPEFDKLYRTLKDNPSLKIRIEGHICCLTENTFDGYDYDAQDFNLSRNRAKYVYDYLVAKGIDEDRLEYKGFGKTRPIVRKELTEEDENRNRRVEIRILEK
ncbi:MAG: OmpA family protein [Sphingobacteriales bacterium]|nr:MAG: OmpA family protein [Sphingobacteriales bacterium]